ncbi:MAG: YjfB family protein [Christensenellaceae bacterium]|jgi:hypothetical protein
MDIGSVDIAAMSIQMKAADIQSQFAVGVMKQTMDTQEEIAQILISDFMQANPVKAPGHLDISV